MHLVEKQKDFISSNKVTMANELAKAKTENDKKVVRQSYKYITIRVSK